MLLIKWKAPIEQNYCNEEKPQSHTLNHVFSHFKLIFNPPSNKIFSSSLRSHSWTSDALSFISDLQFKWAKTLSLIYLVNCSVVFRLLMPKPSGFASLFWSMEISSCHKVNPHSKDPEQISWGYITRWLLNRRKRLLATMILIPAWLLVEVLAVNCRDSKKLFPHIHSRVLALVLLKLQNKKVLNRVLSLLLVRLLLLVCIIPALWFLDIRLLIPISLCQLLLRTLQFLHILWDPCINVLCFHHMETVILIVLLGHRLEDLEHRLMEICPAYLIV